MDPYESQSTRALRRHFGSTFIADAGNHEDRVAMMLGLVLDAMSGKMDSLRKGKSEVMDWRAVAANGGRIVLYLDEDYVQAEDDDTCSPDPIPEMLQVRSRYFPSVFIHLKYPEKLLFSGWHRDIKIVVIPSDSCCKNVYGSVLGETLLAQGSELVRFQLKKERGNTLILD
ncbi:hypothetical protein C5167_012984 [Papaver somniferum]|uniref:Uncharacterized protein n=1 Tax=Papaver somniferum TaxID=3469 RepID=A0A4Y7J316_PAPSO|nr:hypothetical protein C5167_012984 [Papaver somniferum]